MPSDILNPSAAVLSSVEVSCNPGDNNHAFWAGLGNTVSELADGKRNLTIEFYEYASRKKTSDVISEIVAQVDFTLGNPARFEAMSETFGVDLAFSIDKKR